MSRAFVTDLAFFLDEKGAVSTALSKKNGKLLENLGTIISFVTSPPDSPLKQQPVCWSSLSRKRCTGKIDVSIEIRNFTIFWHCLLCGNHGTIRNWKSTLLDQGYR